MKITVDNRRGRGKWQARVSQGVQSFDIGYVGTKEEATFMASMFKKALAAHDEEKKKELCSPTSAQSAFQV
jgi:hypothetical protein